MVIAKWGDPPDYMKHEYRKPEARVAGRQRQVTRVKGGVMQRSG